MDKHEIVTSVRILITKISTINKKERHKKKKKTVTRTGAWKKEVHNQVDNTPTKVPTSIRF